MPFLWYGARIASIGMKKVHFAVIQRDVTDWKHNQTGFVLMEKG